MERSMAKISSSGISVMPFGRAAMSVSFNLAWIMRSAEVRSASLASMAVLTAAVISVRRLILAPQAAIVEIISGLPTGR